MVDWLWSSSIAHQQKLEGPNLCSVPLSLHCAKLDPFNLLPFVAAGAAEPRRWAVTAMTLVVARIIDGRYCSVSDTQITDGAGLLRNGVLSGCIKTVIEGDQVVNFSGNINAFKDDMGAILKAESSSQAAGIVAQVAGKYDVILYRRGDGHLTLVKDGVVTECLAGFIGDRQAFDAYQKSYHEALDDAPQEGYASLRIFRVPEGSGVGESYPKMFRAMKDVIDSSGRSGVGGLVVPCYEDKVRIEYGYYVDVLGDQDADEMQKSGVVRFGTRSGGGYAIEFTTPSDDPNSACFYIMQAYLGGVFTPLDHGVDFVHQIRAGGACEWIRAMETETGKSVKLGLLQLTDCIREAGAALRVDDYALALQYLNMAARNGAEVKGRAEVIDRYAYLYAFSLAKLGHVEKAVVTLQEVVAQTGDHQFSRGLLDKLLAT